MHKLLHTAQKEGIDASTWRDHQSSTYKELTFSQVKYFKYNSFLRHCTSLLCDDTDTGKASSQQFSFFLFSTWWWVTIQLVKLMPLTVQFLCLLQQKESMNCQASQCTKKSLNKQTYLYHYNILFASDLVLQAHSAPHRMWLLENDQSPISRTGVWIRKHTTMHASGVRNAAAFTTPIDSFWKLTN